MLSKSLLQLKSAIWNSYLKPSRKDRGKIAGSQQGNWVKSSNVESRQKRRRKKLFQLNHIFTAFSWKCICYNPWKFQSLDVWCSALNLSNLIGGKICSEKLLAETYFRGGGDTLQPTNSIPGVKIKMRRSSKYGGGNLDERYFQSFIRRKLCLFYINGATHHLQCSQISGKMFPIFIFMCTSSRKSTLVATQPPLL